MLSVTATDLPRLMACNGSRLIGGHTPPTENDTSLRDEGNAADWVVQQVHSGQFTAEELIDRKAPNGVYITDDMVGYLEEYLKVACDGEIEVETNHAGQNWGISGRTDLTAYDAPTRHLYIGDLKYGWSIVEPEMNWTLISHAIGIMLKSGKAVDFVTFTIYQPRPDHQSGDRVRSWTITGAELMNLYRELNETLSSPTEQLNTNKHCKGCPNIAVCPAARLAELNGIDESERAFVEEITNEELSFRLDQLTRVAEIIKIRKKAYDDLALAKMKQGEIVNNYSVAQDLARTSWQPHVTLDMMKSLTDKDIVKEQLKTPNQLKKAGVPEELVDACTERRVKGSKLVRMDANSKAKKLFEKGIK